MSGEQQVVKEFKIDRHFTGPLVREVISRVMESISGDDVLSVTLDFEDTALIDSSGIGSLVSLARDFRDRERSLILRNLGDELYQLFVDTGIDKIFTIQKENDIYHAEIDFFETSVDISLNIDKKEQGDVCIFEMSGVLNHPVGSGYFKQQYLLSLADHKKILLDMEDLTFFDSLSLSTVLNMNSLLKGTGGELRICAANYIVNDLLSTLSINSIISVFNTREEALTGW